MQTFILHVTQPERIQIAVDGASRPAFRCCMADCPFGLQQVSLSSTELGLTGEERQYPVYVQSHVLEQLKRRIPGNQNNAFVMSLQKPKITRRPDGCFLIEYRSGHHKLGYFLGERLQDRVLLKTFLFLTMQGTPESDLLYHKLRLTRSDIEYMELDNLAAFTQTDLRNDPAILKLFDECGCGHLLTGDFSRSGDELRGGFAANVRHYLGDMDKLMRRVEQASRATQLKGGLEAPQPGLQDLAGLSLGRPPQ